MSAKRCPLCGAPLYGWLTLPDETARATVGRPVAEVEKARIVDRCERCGAGVEEGEGPVDLGAEMRELATTLADGTRAVLAPNRRSWQASIGGEGWAPIDSRSGRLVLTPSALELLAEQTGTQLGEIAFPPLGVNQRWMWQTLLNGLTFHPNFAREFRAGRLRPGTARNRFAFFADAAATVLATPFVLLASVPLELIAVALGRGGAMVASLRG